MQFPVVLASTLKEQFERWYQSISQLDAVIIAFGCVLLLIHVYILAAAVRVRRPITHSRLVGLLRFGSFGTELLPLLGIIGTVLALLLTLTDLGNSATFDVRRVATNFAPALSTTVSGLVFAIVNLIVNAFGLIILKENVQAG
ncbi:MAG: MotA/TolQ/ExbB proton channel family protein [Planctomycetota bacterium]